MIMTKTEEVRTPLSHQMKPVRSISTMAINVVEDYKEAIEKQTAFNVVDNNKPSPSTSSPLKHRRDEEDGAASDDTSSGCETNDCKRMRESEVSAMELLEQRRCKNRQSAHQSRLRKRSQMKYLEQQVYALSEENQKLKSSNESMTKELISVKLENAQLRAMQVETMRIAHTLRLAQGGGGGNRAFPPF